MFGIGAQELILILVVALLVFGPKRLPELARSLGKGLAEFRRASSDLRQSLNQEPETPAPPQPADQIAEVQENRIEPPDPGPAQAVGSATTPDPAPAVEPTADSGSAPEPTPVEKPSEPSGG
jgi:TatA/E family protein of Tat protein translocase